MPSKLELLRMKLATFLVEIEELLPRDQWVLTLVARHKESDDKHICVSADDGEKVISTLRRLLDTTPPLKPGELVSQAPKKGAS